LRHWLYGGRTDVSNMVLLCDIDHGLAHDAELVMSRRGRELVVHDRRGRRIWAPAEASPLATVTPLRFRRTTPRRPHRPVAHGLHAADRPPL
jgi:hypothetical protein